MAAPTESDAPTFPIERDPKLRLLIPVIVAIGFGMEGIDTTVITTAIPAMAKSLHSTPLGMSLAVTTYVLVLAVFIPVSGWFADRFSARRVFAAALLTFTAGSVLCGLAIDLPMLIAARALQGLGGAMMTPVGRLILLRSFPRTDLVRAMTYMTLPAILGPVIGPLVGVGSDNLRLLALGFLHQRAVRLGRRAAGAPLRDGEFGGHAAPLRLHRLPAGRRRNRPAAVWA